jgi:hypothetical protein
VGTPPGGGDVAFTVPSSCFWRRRCCVSVR